MIDNLVREEKTDQQTHRQGSDALLEKNENEHEEIATTLHMCTIQ